MKCPLLLAGNNAQPSIDLTAPIDCLKKECAWWEQDLNLCAIKDIALELRYIQLRLADIIEKRPSKGEGEPQ